MFSKALLTATYKDGKPGVLTVAHEKAEHHRFKSENLFKNPKIPKEAYVLRLIQHYFIIKVIETKLKSLPLPAKSEINAFFALSYLQHLWRTPAIEKDLQQLDIKPNQIHKYQVAATTVNYLKYIEKLPPKLLLTHFLMHAAGFMHGGNIIQKKYIDPSNRLTTHQISAHQYDFSAAASFLSTPRQTAMDLYKEMMNQVDSIDVENEYPEIVEECKKIYEIMTDIYDDLCDMHRQQPKLSTTLLANAIIPITALVFILKLMSDFLYPDEHTLSPCP